MSSSLKPQQVSLLQALPKPKRNLNQRVADKTPETIRIAKEYGVDYFDGDRKYGYGGYRYDGRWIPVAKDMVNYFRLKPGQRFLDIGCAKGFLLQDLQQVCEGIEIVGLDISAYALQQADPLVRPHLVRGTAEYLPFESGSFDAVVSINTLHNLPRPLLIQALKEIQRVLKNQSQAFVQVDAYLTPEGKAQFEDWVLTAAYHGYPAEWLSCFEEAGYVGAYDWTIV